MVNPVMYAIAYKFQEDVWVKFLDDDCEETGDIAFDCLLPTERMAEKYIDEFLNEFYTVVAVEIIKYYNGVTEFQYDLPNEWN